MKKSELGLIPEGWAPKAVSEIVSINPKTKISKEGLKPFVPMAGLSTDSMAIGEIVSKAGNSGAKFKNGDTLFARITPCLENGKTGFVNFLPTPNSVAFGSTEFIVLRSKTVCPEFVYLLARSDPFRDHAIKSMTGATGRQRVRNECFDNFLIAQPDAGILSLFKNAVEPMFLLIKNLGLRNSNLRTQRYLLLPKLISGEIDVSDLKQPSAEEVAA